MNLIRSLISMFLLVAGFSVQSKEEDQILDLSVFESGSLAESRVDIHSGS